MKKILSYLFSPLFLFSFAAMCGIFHVVQVVALKFFGKDARKKSVDFWNYLIVKSFAIMGCKVRFEGLENIPENVPVIIVANHQSAYDIPPIIYAFRKITPKFISKIELGKGIPGISYNLRHGGSVLIDRSNRMQSIKEISKLGKEIAATNTAAVIYPEGTRSKDGTVKPFQAAGIITLLRAAPNALIVPFAIEGHHEFVEYGSFPLKFGTPVTYHILPAINPKNRNGEEVVLEVEDAIKKVLKQNIE